MARIDSVTAPAVLALALLASAARSDATPCTAYKQAEGSWRTGDVARTATLQLGAPETEVLDVYRQGRWRLIYVEPHISDETVLIYSGTPGAGRYVTKWSGAARLDEGAVLRQWVRTNAPGIPSGLARCFGWYVTVGRTR